MQERSKQELHGQRRPLRRFVQPLPKLAVVCSAIAALWLTGGPTSVALGQGVAPTATARSGQPTPVSAQPTPTVQPTPMPGPIPAAPLAPRDTRYFEPTQFRIDNNAFWDYFNSRGGVDTFGFPVSRTFTFLGCTTQIFQRQLFQQCGEGAPVQTMNLLDPDLMPYNQINFSTFPAHNPTVAEGAPAPNTPNYGRAVLDYIRSVAPDTYQGQPVNFFTTFVTTVPGSDSQANPDLTALTNLEIWGFPTSAPQADPANAGFIYQRFQRGIMHYDASTHVTRGILLADYFKGIIIGQPGSNLPPDLLTEAQGSRYYQQYCPGQPNWVCRPNDLPGTDLTFAFEKE